MEPTKEQRGIFHSMGDINDDGVIDEQDQTLLTAAFGKNNTAADWITGGYYLADLNGDGVVDVIDARILGDHFGDNIQSFFNLNPPSANLPFIAVLGTFGVIGGIVLGYFLFRKKPNNPVPFNRPL